MGGDRIGRAGVEANMIDLSAPLNGLINLLLLLVILVVLVVMHEFGHFIVARRAGVKVHEFGVGFPPRAKTLGTDRHGTTYTLNWLPIGGFVRLEGEEGESDDPRSFVRQKLRTRLTILLAGVAMNFALAMVIFAFIAAFADPIASVRVAEVEPNTPAEQAGLKGSNVIGTDAEGNPIYDETGDVIVAIDGNRFPTFDRLDTPVPSLAYLREHAGQPVTLTVLSADGSTRDVTVTLRQPTTPQQGALGIRVHPRLVQGETTADPLTAVGKGITRTVDASTLIMRGLQDLVANIGNPQIAGPIGMVSAIGDVRRRCRRSSCSGSSACCRPTSR